MDEHPIHIFFDLIKLDQNIQALEENIQKLHQGIAKLKQEEQMLFSALEQAKHNLHDTRKEVDVQELKMKELDQLEVEEKKKLEGVTHQKEYQAIQAEIDHIKKQQHNHEKILVEAWSALEAAQKEYETQKETHNEKIEKLHAAQEERLKKVEDLKVDLDEQYKKRLDLERQVPEEWLEKYLLMRAQVPNPVVPVLQNSCSACFYSIPRQDLLLLERRRVLQCKGCYRFLYKEQTKKEENQEEEEKE